MKSITLFIASLLLLTSLFAQDKTEKLNSYLKLLKQNNKAMFSLTILEDGQLFYKRSIGFASVEEKKTNWKNTKYRIGSITKMFTSAIIFQLIEEDKLSLDTKLAKFYPDIENADEITIAHLLGHRSGIFSFTDDPDYMEYFTTFKSKQEMINMINGYDSVFDPDEKYVYSNSNYLLLGYIIEQITGETYALELEKRIAYKLKLYDTYYGAKIGLQEYEAHSYSFSESAWQLQPETDMSIPHGAGAIVSTPYDLSVFINELFNNKIVSAASLEQMMLIKEGYGKGMVRFPFYDKVAYGHDGGIDGFVSNLAYFPDEKVAICITANGLNYNFNDILIGILSIYFELPFDLPDFSAMPIDLTDDDLKKYEGIYSTNAMPLKITIRLDEGQVFAQATGQGAFPLTPFSKTDFRFDPAGIIIKFETDEDGNVNYNSFVLHQGGAKTPFTRE